MAMLPTQRTLQYLRDQGHSAGVVERYNSHSRTRHDLFGFIDIVAIVDGQIVGIQCTSTANISSRCTKIKTECATEAILWLHAGGLIEVWGWKNYKKSLPDDRRKWRETVKCLTLGDIYRV